MGDKALRGNKLTSGRGQAGHGPIPYLNKPGQAQGTHGGKAKGGRIGLKHGTKPWGTGPKPGTHEFLEHTIHKRKSKAIGGAIKKVIQGGKKIIDKIKTPGKSNKFETWETIGIPGSPGPKKGKYKHIDTIMESIEKQKKTGKAAGGRIGKAAGGWTKIPRPTRSQLHEVLGGGERGKPHSTSEGRQAAGKRFLKRTRRKALDDMHDEAWAGKDAEKGKPHSSKEGRIAGGRQNFKRWAKEAWGAKKGGKADKKWIQKAVDPKHKGYCTPMTKKTCTPARKALARTFKKKAKTGW